MQLLIEQHRVALPVGRIALSVLLFQDLMVVPILFIVGFLGSGREVVAGGVTALIKPFAEALGSSDRDYAGRPFRASAAVALRPCAPAAAI